MTHPSGDLGNTVAMTPIDSPSVVDREDRIAGALTCLDEKLSKLSERLMPVLADAPPPPADVSLATPPAPSPHGQRLTHLAEWVERLAEDVNRLAYRVDL